MTTEAEALANILSWSADSPSWQRDALRRLATRPSLEPAEIDELVAICKGDTPAAPLEAAHLREPNRDQGEVHLRQMHSVRHVNALAADQRLTLHRVGLTIIYGDNGSGKSGYARVLKRACRARVVGRVEESGTALYPSPTGGRSGFHEAGRCILRVVSRVASYTQGRAMNGFYAIYFTGLTGSGFGMLAFKDGTITGVDMTGGQFDGEYRVVGQEVVGQLTVTLPPGAVSVTGHPAGPAGLRFDIPMRLPSDLGGGHTLSVPTPLGPINVNVKKLRDLP
jgi:hypothetical protein